MRIWLYSWIVVDAVAVRFFSLAPACTVQSEEERRERVRWVSAERALVCERHVAACCVVVVVCERVLTMMIDVWWNGWEMSLIFCFVFSFWFFFDFSSLIFCFRMTRHEISHQCNTAQQLRARAGQHTAGRNSFWWAASAMQIMQRQRQRPRCQLNKIINKIWTKCIDTTKIEAKEGTRRWSRELPLDTDCAMCVGVMERCCWLCVLNKELAFAYSFVRSFVQLCCCS